MSFLRLGLCLTFFVLFSETLPVAITHAAQDPLVVEQATDEEARQVQEVSDIFERRMRETRDVGLLKDLFLDDFVRLQVEAEMTSYPDKGISLFESIPLSLKNDLAPQVSQRDWERFYAARLNLRYYFVLLLASRAQPSDMKNSNNSLVRKIYPADVLTLLQANPFVKGEYGVEHDHNRHQIETLDEFLSLINTLDRAATMLRQRFLKEPPEQTRIYQENLRLASNEHTARKTGLIRPHVYGTDKSRLGFPIGTRFFHRITADSMFELSFVKTDNGIKIIRAIVYPFN